MTRRSREEAAITREEIIDAASRLIRSEGMEAMSVAKVMGAAGLTHGGFYKHFASKEELCALAIQRASEEVIGLLHKRLAASSRQGLSTFLDTYLSKAHVSRLQSGHGCVVAALVGEASNAAKEPRASLTQAAEALLTLIEEQLPAGSASHSTAAGMMATVVGALVLSRAVDDPKLADEFLKGAHALLAEL